MDMQARQAVKDRLKLYGAIRYEMQQIEARIWELEDDCGQPKAQQLDAMPKGSGGADVVQTWVLTKETLLEQYRRKHNAAVQALALIEQMLERLDDPRERALIRCKYIEERTWEAVCVEMSYSWRQVHRIHSSALAHLVEAERGEQDGGSDDCSR